MKKILISISFFAWMTGSVVAQEPQSVDTISPKVVTIDDVIESIDDTLIINLGGQEVIVVLNDHKSVAEWTSDVIKEYNKRKPSGVYGWIGFIVFLVTSVIGTPFAVQALKALEKTKDFFRKKNAPANYVAVACLVAGVASSIVMGGFDVVFSIGTASVLYSAIQLVYVNFIKKVKQQ